MTASTRWRAWLVGVAIAAALLGGALLARMGPALSLALTLALPGAESWLAPLHAAVVVEEMSIEAGGRRLVADLYRPSAPRGALLLVHGLSRAGRRHPDLVRLARLLARQHRLVLVPHFEGLAAYRLSGREVAEVRAALRALAAQSPSIGVAGLSFGAGPALLAAADVPDLALVASFGGYAVRALVLNRREDAVGTLLAALPAEARAALEQLSPLAAIPRLSGRLLIAHGAGDVSIPFTESLRLAEASAGRADAVILETFEHTRAQSFWPTLDGRLRDGRRLLRLADALLAER